MQNSYSEEERKAFPDIVWTNEQNVADEHVFDLLVTFSRAAQQKNRRSGCHDVGNSNDRFLRNLAGAFACDRKNSGAGERKAERNHKGFRAFQIEMKQDRDANA